MQAVLLGAGPGWGVTRGGAGRGGAVRQGRDGEQLGP